ncbi:hypothetical protein OS189_15195 [Sulfitobacter sp. F26169L]|uniref:hypothetical protein n=1 Tax=Sulfitobacter sp. F26169L TaxID=2996015 RepID=UPI0022609AD0|nr:hypothetical protein [Sulfitobacter sp. F26169L]MCX7567691.1 hypothetical protein [Sulfitobacter sp. F26169L]
MIGVLNVKPIPSAVADAVTSDAIDTFSKVVAYEMPGVIRVNSVSPAVLTEVWDVYPKMISGFEPAPSKLLGKAFGARS